MEAKFKKYIYISPENTVQEELKYDVIAPSRKMISGGRGRLNIPCP